MTIKTKLARFGKWALSRAKERSTWTGLAMIAGAVGLPGVGAAIGQAGQIATLILGSGLVAATTRAVDDAAAG